VVADDEARLRARIVQLAEQYGRYGYRRITGLLVNEGWHVNHKRVERIWREEGLKVPQKQPKRRRLWLNDGSCVRLRPAYPGHVWSYDFVQDRTHNGRTFRMLTIIDEFTRECLSIDVDRRLSSDRVLERLTDLFAQRGAPDYIRSDNGPDALHRAGQSMGERLRGVLQRQVAGRAAQRGDLRYAVGGAGARGAVEETLQHGATAQRTGLPSPCPGGAPALGSGLRSAQPSTQGCMTGHSVPHCDWYHLWGQVTNEVDPPGVLQ
jgi:transposase InsO family protein